MKKLFILFFPFFLFAQSQNVIFLSFPYNLQGQTHYNNMGFLSPFAKSSGSENTDLNIIKHDGERVGFAYNGYLYSRFHHASVSGYDAGCLCHNGSELYVTMLQVDGPPQKTYVLISSLLPFCKNKNDYVYSFSDNAWFPTTLDNNLSPICPDGETWDAEKETCQKVPECPSQSALIAKVASNCGGSQYVASVSCDPKTGKITYSCLSCSDVAKKFIKYCADKGELLDMQCKSTDDKYLSFVYNCVPKNDTNNSNNSNNSDKNSSGSVSSGNGNAPSTQSSCLNSGGNWLCISASCSCIYNDSNSTSGSSSGSSGQNTGNSNNNSTSGSSLGSSGQNTGNSNNNSTSGSSSGSSGQNSGNSNNNSKSKKDCCNLYNNKQLGDTWTLISSNNGVSVWKKQGSDCEVSIHNGVCSNIGSGSNSI